MMAGRTGEARSDEDMRELRQMYRHGGTNAEIALVLERTNASISAQVSRMKRRRLLGLSNPDPL